MNSKLEDYISHGKACFEARDYEEAYRQFSLAIGMIEEGTTQFFMNDEELAKVYLFRGSALFSDSEREALNNPDIFNQILDDYDQAVSVQPNNPIYRNVRGKLYLNCQFTNFLEEAREDFSQVVKRHPDNSMALKSLGEIYSREEAYDQAIYYFSKALEKGEDKEVYMLRGVCQFRKTVPDFAAAADDFGKAQVFLPRLEELYVWRAQCFLELNDYGAAIGEYDKLLEIAPNKAGYYVDRGAVKIDHDPDGALADFDRALEIADHPLAYNNRAYYYLQQGDYAQAIQDAMRALEVDGEYSIAYATLAEIYARMDDEEQFYKYLELALKFYYDDIVEVMLEPAFEKYNNDSRFLDLIGKTGKA